MENNNLIHVKLDYDEALIGKKDVLSLQINLIEILKRIQRFKAFRDQELKNKIEIVKQIKKTRATFNRLQAHLPKPNFPKKFGKHKETYQLHSEAFLKTNTSLEAQLKEIERKLKEL